MATVGRCDHSATQPISVSAFRDYALLALLVGCALRRRELASLAYRGSRDAGERLRSSPICNSLLPKCVGHNLRVLDRVKGWPTREWYLRAALEYGWSQNVLIHMISGQLHKSKARLQRTSSERCRRPDQIWQSRFCAIRTTFDFLTVSLLLPRTSKEKRLPEQWEPVGLENLSFVLYGK